MDDDEYLDLFQEILERGISKGMTSPEVLEKFKESMQSPGQSDWHAKPQKDWIGFEDNLKALLAQYPVLTFVEVAQHLEELRVGQAPVPDGKKFYRKQWTRLKETHLQVNVEGSEWIEIKKRKNNGIYNNSTPE